LTADEDKKEKEGFSTGANGDNEEKANIARQGEIS
jgi:hypothetical protein